MPYQEVAAARTDRSRTYQDSEDPRKKVWSGGLARLHFHDGSSLSPVDFRPEHVTAGGNDIWRVTQSGWHYALGQPADKATDGWIGFGGRRGEHWLKFRLARVGYLHGPTGPEEGWQDLGGAPTYNRQNLSHTPHAATIGPNGDEIYVSASAEWRDLWPALPAGELSLRWSLDGYRLKEDVVINQAAREWIAANRPPSTPAAETLFGFVFQFDWSDIPAIKLRGLVQGRDADWEAGGESVELRNAADELLAFMPLGHVYVEDAEGNRESVELTRRFWRDPDGNHYLLVGARVPDIAALPPGDLHFDPPVNESVGTGADDGWGKPDTTFNNTFWHWLGNNGGDTYLNFIRFATVGVPAGATVDTASISFYSNQNRSGTTCNVVVDAEAADDPAAPSDYSDLSGRSHTSASVDWNNVAGWSSGVRYDSPDIADVIQEVIDRGGWGEDQAMLIFVDDNSSSTSAFRNANQYDNSAANSCQLDIEYTEGGGGTDHPLSGTAPVTVGASGAVSVAKSLAGTAAAAVDASASLTRAIPLSGSAAIAVGAAASLSSAKPLAGSAAIAVDASAALTRAVGLAGSSAITVDGSAAITNAKSLAGTAPVAVGGSAALTRAIPVAGTGAIAVAASAALSSAKPLAGQADIAIDASGALTRAVAVAGSAAIAVSAAGAASVAKSLAGSGAIAIDGSAALTRSIPLTGSSAIAVDGSAALVRAVALAGAAAVVIDASGALTIEGAILLSGTAAITIGGSAALTRAVGLAGTAPIAVDGTAALIRAIALSGAAPVVWGGAGALTRAIPIAGSAAIVWAATGALGTGVVVAVPTTALVGTAITHTDLAGQAVTHTDLTGEYDPADTLEGEWAA